MKFKIGDVVLFKPSISNKIDYTRKWEILVVRPNTVDMIKIFDSKRGFNQPDDIVENYQFLDCLILDKELTWNKEMKEIING